MSQQTIRYREIPYNYTSFSDREIIQKYFDSDTWDTLQRLRSHRVTGRSAKLLFEVIGDIFAIDRNPYIFNDFLEAPPKLKALKATHSRKLRTIEQGANDAEVPLVLQKVRALDDTFFGWFKEERELRKRVTKRLGAITEGSNIFFSAYHKVLHVTDATDWRVEYPRAIIYPETTEEIAQIVRAAKELGLKIIPRGGGTGLTGGAVPLTRNTIVINTEKLDAIHPIEEVTIGGVAVPIIEADAGVITDVVSEYCTQHGYVFATDPTSAWASTIGGNIAENCGGKKAVIWGTAIDNIYAFKIVNAEGELLEVRRRNHPHRKILPDEQVIFEVFNLHRDTLVKTIEIAPSDLRKKGVGKDITNKALGGLPGVQKEGGDGIIVSGTFVLYHPFAHTRTACLEFYGDDMSNAAKAILTVLETFEKNSTVFLTALEHFDNKYAEAIGYKNKSARSEKPRAVLLIDIDSNDEVTLDQEAESLLRMVAPFNCEGFLASIAAERQTFWQDRKNLGAIARHTNAFKLNEDVVIPIGALADFANFVESLNHEKQQKNDQQTTSQLIIYLNKATIKDDHYFDKRKQNATAQLSAHGAAPDFAHVLQIFDGYESVQSDLQAIIDSEQTRKIIIATHMHAGDGNIHVNIPVHSGDYEMMMEADDTAGRVMRETAKLGGVISGEHGIGLTKLKFIDDDILDAYGVYKKEADPDDLFNPKKLSRQVHHDSIYTPSLNLLKKEALIIEAVDLEGLTTSISACVRCGKCKRDCNTQYPRGTIHYCPRNKNLAVSLVAEAILYEAQKTDNLGRRNLTMLKEIANYCTMCHNCYKPCPVDIDFGNVTLAIRKLLRKQSNTKPKLLTRMTLFYLRQKGYHTNRFFRLSLLKFGYSMQRIAHTLNKPAKPVTRKVTPALDHILDGRFPAAGNPSLRELFSIHQPGTFYNFKPKQKEIAKSVFYFPGCGSERMFPEISIATVALLNNMGIEVVIPPQYTCCGYPLLANGLAEDAQKTTYANSVLFHRISETVAYMEIKDVAVSCGTCKEMLTGYKMDEIFEGAGLIDINELLSREGLTAAPSDSVPVLYHKPCHSPITPDAHTTVIQQLLGQASIVIPNCCGEGGTLALSTPHISTALRNRKTRNINETCGTNKMSTSLTAEVLTSCPSCVQGLSKIDGKLKIKGIPLVVAAAEHHLGTNWKRDFVSAVKQNNLLEHIIL